MPIQQHININDSETKIGIWEIEEDETFFLSALSLYADELAEVATLNARKRLEWYCGRHLLHQVLGDSDRQHCKKDIFGKPYLAQDHRHISLSHSRDFAAVIVSPHSVGIDIQYLTPKIERIATKFMSIEELDSIATEHRLVQLHVYWGAKEALYKAYGKRELDFKKHIFLDAFHFSNDGGQTFGRVAKDDVLLHFKIQYRMIRDYVLVWCERQV